MGGWPAWGKTVSNVVKELTDQHPYYPRTVSLPGYRYQKLEFEFILGVFAGLAALVVLVSFTLAARRKSLSVLDRVVIAWWTLTGLIHFFVEGWVVSVPNFYKDNKGTYLSEVWKEYAKADSRYATRDGFVIVMEGFTAFVEGPLCFVVVFAMVYRKPWRHVLQILIAFGQLYGDILYYLSSWYEGFIHSRPEALYFWAYFVGANFIWVLVPSLIILRCARQVCSAVSLKDRAKKIEEEKSL